MNNEVILIDYYGGDHTHCNSAWQSTGHELGLDLESIPLSKRSQAIFEATAATKQKTPGELLKMLAQSNPRHTTPFEKSALHFQVTTEIASHIHLIKHRIAVSINAESARYKELMADKYYLPVDWDEEERDRLAAHCERCFQEYHECLDRLVSKGFSRKRAKESARFYLPYASQLNFDVQFNFASFMHFVNLRCSEPAQEEIKAIGNKMLDEVRSIPGEPFKLSLEAFGYH